MAEVYRIHVGDFTSSGASITTGIHSGMVGGIYATHSGAGSATFTVVDEVGYNLFGKSTASGNVTSSATWQKDQEDLDGTAIVGPITVTSGGTVNGTLSVYIYVAP